MTVYIQHKGRVAPLTEWAQEYGLAVAVVHRRIRRWSIRDTLELPPDATTPRDRDRASRYSIAGRIVYATDPEVVVGVFAPGSPLA